MVLSLSSTHREPTIRSLCVCVCSCQLSTDAFQYESYLPLEQGSLAPIPNAAEVLDMVKAFEASQRCSVGVRGPAHLGCSF